MEAVEYRVSPSNPRLLVQQDDPDIPAPLWVNHTFVALDGTEYHVVSGACCTQHAYQRASSIFDRHMQSISEGN